MEQGALKIIEALLAYGGLGAALAMAGLGVAYYFHRLVLARERELSALQEKRLEEVRSLTALIERVNAAMQTAAALTEARDTTMRQLVNVISGLKHAFDAHREMSKGATERIEQALKEIRKQ